MSFTHLITQNVQFGSESVKSDRDANTITGSQRVSLSEAVPDSSTDLQINISIDVSACKSFYLISDQDVTVETNDGTTPDDTISLLAGVPYVWTENSYDTFKFGTDITAIFVTNSSGASATVQIRALVDATP